MRIRILGFEEGHAALELDGTPPLRSVGRKCLLLGIILHLYCGGKVHSSPRVKANLLYAASSHGVPCYDSLHESCFARPLSERISRSRVIYTPPNHVVWDAHMRITARAAIPIEEVTSSMLSTLPSSGANRTQSDDAAPDL